jgi:hypothetical protein
MPKLDFDEIRLLLEPIKMNQGTLKEITALSAGGLALYFSFIGRASFLSSPKAIGILVVLAWIISLIAAIIAHLNHGKLFLCIFHLSALDRQEKEYLNSIKEKLDQTVDKKGLEGIKSESEEIRKRGDLTIDAFENEFFPLQNRTVKLTSLSLYAFVLGFLLLGAAYVLWAIKV